MNKAVIFPNPARDPDFTVTKRLCDLFKKNGLIPVCSEEACAPGLPCLPSAEAALGARFALCVGGDGTILRAVSTEGIGDLPVAGVNTGHKGYLACYKPEDTESLAALAAGRYHISRRLMLRAEFSSASGLPLRADALNDIVLSRGGTAQTVTLEVFADAQSLGSFMADGLLVSTATGSTAYNLSAGGPVMDAEVDALIVTPVCPHTMWARSFILAANRRVSVTLRRHSARLTADGGLSYDIGEHETVHIRRSPRQARLIIPEGQPSLQDVTPKLML